MTVAAPEKPPVAEKKKGKPPKKYGTLIRVSDAFAESIKRASSFEGTSVAEFANAHLLPITEKRYRDAVVRAARKMEAGE